MDNKLLPSPLSLAILGLVSLEPHSGYDLRKVFSSTPMGHFSTSPGAIYPALKRLETDGLIEGTVEKQDTLRPRQTFTITKKGRDALEARLLRPITDEDVVWRLEELMLRFAFMGNVLARKKSLDFLRELLPLLEGYVRHLETHLETHRGEMSVNGPYALEQGIEKYKATVRWTKKVIAEMEDR